MDGPKLLTLGVAAMRLGVLYHHVERLARRGTIRYTTAGRVRLVREDSLPAIRDALLVAGYLSDAQEVAVHAH